MSQTPQQQIEWLVEQYRSGKAPAAACQRGLDAVETYFQQKAAELERTGASDEELAEPVESFQLFMDAVAHLRAYLEGEEGARETGLALAAQGQLAIQAYREGNAERRQQMLAELEAARAAGVSASDSWGRLEG